MKTFQSYKGEPFCSKHVPKTTSFSHGTPESPSMESIQAKMEAERQLQRDATKYDARESARDVPVEKPEQVSAKEPHHEEVPSEPHHEEVPSEQHHEEVPSEQHHEECLCEIRTDEPHQENLEESTHVHDNATGNNDDKHHHEGTVNNEEQSSHAVDDAGDSRN